MCEIAQIRASVRNQISPPSCNHGRWTRARHTSTGSCGVRKVIPQMSMIRRSLTFTVWALLVARPTLGGQATAPAASPSPDYAQEAYVIEQSRTTWRFENDGTGRRDSYLRVKVQS